MRKIQSSRSWTPIEKDGIECLTNFSKHMENELTYIDSRWLWSGSNTKSSVKTSSDSLRRMTEGLRSGFAWDLYLVTDIQIAVHITYMLLQKCTVKLLKQIYGLVDCMYSIMYFRKTARVMFRVSGHHVMIMANTITLQYSIVPPFLVSILLSWTDHKHCQNTYVSRDRKSYPAQSRNLKRESHDGWMSVLLALFSPEERNRLDCDGTGWWSYTPPSSYFVVLDWKRRNTVYSTPNGYRVVVFKAHSPFFVLPANEDELGHDQHVDSPEFDDLDEQPKNAFALHDACWNILESYFYNTPVPLDRLAQAIQLRPEQMSDKLLNPWPINHDPSKRLTNSDHRLHLEEHVPDFEQWSMNSKGDTFAKLPLEIQEVITTCLPTEDFYQLRYVSRFMGAWFFSQRFWATRFDVD